MDAFFTLTAYYGHSEKMTTKWPHLGHGHAQNINLQEARLLQLFPTPHLTFASSLPPPLYFANKSLGYSHRFYFLRLRRKLAYPDPKIQMANR